MHVWRGELQPDALRPVEHVFVSQPGAPYSKKKGLLSQTFFFSVYGAPGMIRTCDPLVRS